MDEQARLVRWLTAPAKPADPNADPGAEGKGEGGGKAWTGITGLYIWVRGRCLVQMYTIPSHLMASFIPFL